MYNCDIKSRCWYKRQTYNVFHHSISNLSVYALHRDKIHFLNDCWKQMTIAAWMFELLSWMRESPSWICESFSWMRESLSWICKSPSWMCESLSGCVTHFPGCVNYFVLCSTWSKEVDTIGIAKWANSSVWINSSDSKVVLVSFWELCKSASHG